MAYKGRYSVRYPEKYNGDPTCVIYRSLLERSFMRYLDNNPRILKWSSEEVVVRYVSPIDGREHRYFVDFWVRRLIPPNNEVRECLIEIKPEKQVTPPSKPQRITRRYKMDLVTYVINDAKWNAAKAFCEDRGWDWKILTERDLAPQYLKELSENKEDKRGHRTRRRGNNSTKKRNAPSTP